MGQKCIEKGYFLFGYRVEIRYNLYEGTDNIKVKGLEMDLEKMVHYFGSLYPMFRFNPEDLPLRKIVLDLFFDEVLDLNEAQSVLDNLVTNALAREE